MAITVFVLALGAAVASPAGASGKSQRSVPKSHAVVLMSGGASNAPFTTPTSACGVGFPAGDAVSEFRRSLLAAGDHPFSAPAQPGGGAQTSPEGWGAYSDCPPALPAHYTVDTVGPITQQGRTLALFVTYLHRKYGIDSVDFGLFSRGAIKTLQDQSSPVKVRSLTTVGTPWSGSYAADAAAGDAPPDLCAGQALCDAVLAEFAKAVGMSTSVGAGQQVTRRYLDGTPGHPGWNRQGRALAKIPVTAIGGDYFKLPGGSPQAWPNDGLVAIDSAFATHVPTSVAPHMKCMVRPDVHSLYYSNQVLGIPDSAALTGDPLVIRRVTKAVREAHTPTGPSARVGCDTG